MIESQPVSGLIDQQQPLDDDSLLAMVDNEDGVGDKRSPHPPHHHSRSKAARSMPPQLALPEAMDCKETVERGPSCVECEDQEAEVICLTCDEPFCQPCWGAQHRRGKRAQHVKQVLLGEMMAAPSVQPESMAATPENQLLDAGTGGLEEPLETPSVPQVPGVTEGAQQNGTHESSAPAATDAERHALADLAERCRFIPLRLTEQERRLLTLLEGVLAVSEYTDRVDTMGWRSKSEIMLLELRRALHYMLGLAVVGDLEDGRDRAQEKLSANKDLFRRVFEVGRRYKIMNPDKMRSNYGKMMYMLQDAQTLNKWDLVEDIHMVGGFLEDKGLLSLLQDPRILTATEEVAVREDSRQQVDAAVSRKRSARRALVRGYARGGEDGCSEEEVERVLDSISDSNNYLAFNLDPVQRMLHMLKSNFSLKEEPPFSLRLTGGRVARSDSFQSSYGMYSYSGSGFMGRGLGGKAKLSHDHPTQFTFVGQSLRLWCEIMKNMYRLWYYADSDLLSGRASYRLQNTGQGLQRVQSCPSVSACMRNIVHKVQLEVGEWVGLSVVHLGDRDVPNALTFIDKYTQVPRILGPIANLCDNLSSLMQDEDIATYIETQWGDARTLQMTVLSDYFKHGFDGDGDDGGSCIDGRLTSTWNWCSKVAKKEYYNLWMLAGFQGFDGDWKG